MGRVIERRAWSRVNENRQQVAQIVQAKAEAKVRLAFDELVEERLAKVNRLAQRRDLASTVLGSPKYVCWTKGGWLNIAVTTETPSSHEPSSADTSGDLAAALEATLRQSAVLGTAGPPVQVWVHEQVLGEQLASLLRRVDRARVFVRQVMAAQAAPNSAVAFVSQPSSGRSYDFSVCGDWIVIHAGDSGCAKLLAMAVGDGENAAPAAELVRAR